MIRVIDERFELLSLIAEGASASVWRAIDRSTLGEVAVKLIARGSDAESRLPREIQALSTVTHRRLPRLIAHGRAPEGPYLAMTLVRGTPLRALSHRPHALSQLRALGLAICEPLSALHRAGLVHRDLKPEHVILDSASDFSSVSLVDLGLALALDGPRNVTGNAIVGTLGYLPPEQLRAPAPAATPQWDVFSLGAILYECATGVAPFEAPDRAQLVARMLSRSIAPMRERNSSITDAMESLVLRMLSPSPSDRPPDADAARELITQIQLTNDFAVTNDAEINAIDHRAIAVIVGQPLDPRTVEQSTDTVTTQGVIAGVAPELLPKDALATETADGAALVVLRAATVDTALVARAIQCAQLLARALPTHRFAVSASLGTISDRWPRGPALARALALRAHGTQRDRVLLDEHTALLAQESFALERVGPAFSVHSPRASCDTVAGALKR